VEELLEAMERQPEEEDEEGAIPSIEKSFRLQRNHFPYSYVKL